MGHLRLSAYLYLDAATHLGTWITGGAERKDDVHQEEGEPGDDERRDDAGHGSRRATLLGHLLLGLLVDEAVDGVALVRVGLHDGRRCRRLVDVERRRRLKRRLAAVGGLLLRVFFLVKFSVFPLDLVDENKNKL